MRVALIENGKVNNVVIVNEGQQVPLNGVVLSENVRASPGWLYDGEKFIETHPIDAKTVPYRISKMQAKLALNAVSLLEVVETAIEGGPAEARIYWQEASHFHRDHPLILSLSTAVGMGPDDVDNLFIEAEKII